MSAENPLIPMGAITGRPTRQVIASTLAEWRQVGVSQFLIYPRSGCEVEYLSEEWLRICEWICEEATRLGFTSIWLYDEFNWPSGTCNGKVLREHPDFATQMLCVVPNGDGDVTFEVRRGTRETDLCNPAAVDCFIQNTHAVYEKRLGQYFGTLIKGFFTDEPDIAFFRDSHTEDAILTLPYYTGLEEDYRRLTGGGLRDDIRRALATHGPAFYQEPLHRLLARRFRTVFADRVSAWCRERGLVLTGHLMNEISAEAALRCNGHPLEVLSGFTLPGMDDIRTKGTMDRTEWLTYGTAMYAIDRQGNHGGLAELYAVGPCSMTLGHIRRQFWLAAAFGVSRYVMAVSPLDVRGNIEKPYYFNPFTHTQPWFPLFPELGEEARRAAAWAGKARRFRVAVRYPYTAQPVSDLARQLTAAQVSWQLLLPQDASDAPVILAWRNGTLQEERTGKGFTNFGDFHAWLDETFPDRPRITEADGGAATDLFLREYQDGNLLVINLRGIDRRLVLETASGRRRFTLHAEGVAILPPAASPAEETASPSPLPREGWEVRRESPNTMRTLFINGETRMEFTVAEVLEGVALAIRSHAPVELLLDGRPVTADRPCTGLPRGFSELYQETAPFQLPPGSHRLELVNGAQEYPYLPCAFLLGDFAQSPDGPLARGRDDGKGLYGYVGKLVKRRTWAIPATARSVQIDTSGLAAELRVNHRPIGTRLWAPFVWEIPEDLRGQSVELELVLYTSCANLFGEKAFTYPGALPGQVSNRPIIRTDF